jgi:hypothetical protein
MEEYINRKQEITSSESLSELILFYNDILLLLLLWPNTNLIHFTWAGIQSSVVCQPVLLCRTAENAPLKKRSFLPFSLLSRVLIHGKDVDSSLNDSEQLRLRACRQRAFGIQGYRHKTHTTHQGLGQFHFNSGSKLKLELQLTSWIDLVEMELSPIYTHVGNTNR